MSKSPKVSRTALINKLVKVRKYSVVLFIVFILSIYGFILVQTKLLLDVQPTEDAISSHIEATKTLHIDPAVVQRLQDLQDNSVSVQGLFDQARNDPFQQ